MAMANTNGYIFLKFLSHIYFWQRIHSPYYSEIDFGIHRVDWLTLKHGTLKLLLKKYFYQWRIKLKAKNFIFNFKIYKIFSSASQTVVSLNLCLFLLCSPILNISILLFSSRLNKLNTLSACHKLEPIGNTQSLSSEFIQQNCAVEINTTPEHY